MFDWPVISDRIARIREETPDYTEHEQIQTKC
jgi:hypothetical protein